MTGDAPNLEMRAFAMSLLVAATGDARTVRTSVNIVYNAAFRYSFELVGAFPELARRNDPALGKWLGGHPTTGDFFVFCGYLLDALDERVRGRHNAFDPVTNDSPSAYDHAAYLALGQTLCRTGGVRLGKFPPLRECFLNLARAQPRELQKAFLTNYLGNILQDYFDASRIRAQSPTLPPDTEERLRSEDAAALTEVLFSEFDNETTALDVSVLQKELQDLIGRVWEAERALDD